MSQPLIQYLKEIGYIDNSILFKRKNIIINDYLFIYGYLISLGDIKVNEISIKDKFNYLLEIKKYLKDPHNYIYTFFTLNNLHAYIPEFNHKAFIDVPEIYQYSSTNQDGDVIFKTVKL